MRTTARNAELDEARARAARLPAPGEAASSTTTAVSRSGCPSPSPKRKRAQAQAVALTPRKERGHLISSSHAGSFAVMANASQIASRDG